MALAAAQMGWRGSGGRNIAELTACLAVVVPLVWIGTLTFDRWPEIGNGLPLAAALWVGRLVITLWHPNEKKRAEPDISAGRVLVTTLLNPKALVFGLVLPPQGGPAFLPGRIAGFSLLIVLVALLRTFGGTLAGSGGGRRDALRRMLWLHRFASLAGHYFVGQRLANLGPASPAIVRQFSARCSALTICSILNDSFGRGESLFTYFTYGWYRHKLLILINCQNIQKWTMIWDANLTG